MMNYLACRPTAVAIRGVELFVVEAGDRGFDDRWEVAYFRDLALTLLRTEHWHETQKTTALAPRLNRGRKYKIRNSRSAKQITNQPVSYTHLTLPTSDLV